jgi:hypothetical protein
LRIDEEYVNSGLLFHQVKPESGASFTRNSQTKKSDKITGKATQEQALALKTIVNNMETGNKKTEETVAASLDPQNANVVIISLMHDAFGGQ